MMGCKRNYSSSGDLCQNAKSLYMYAIHMCALSGIGNVPGVSAIFYGSGDFIYVYTGNNRLTRILSILIGKII